MINLFSRLALVNPHLLPTETESQLIETCPQTAREEAEGQRLKTEIILLQQEIGAIPLDFSVHYTNSQLADELLALEFQRLLLRVDFVPVELIPYPAGLEPAGTEPRWLVKKGLDRDQYYWLTKNYIRAALAATGE